MSARRVPFPPLSRTHLLFAAAVLLQVGFLRSLGSASTEDAFSILVTAAQAAPFLVLALVLWPAAALMAVPFLAVVPGSFMGFTPAEWLLLGALAVAVLRDLAAGRVPPRPRGVEWFYALYILWAAFAVSQAVEVRDALGAFKRILVLFLAFEAGLRYLGSIHAGTALRAVAAVATLVALQLLAVIVVSGYPVSYLLTRSGALTNLGWGYSNYVAAVAALCAASAIPLALYGRTWERLLGISGIVSAGFVSLATISRGGTLALAVILLAATAIEARRRFLFAATILAAMASVYLLSPLGRAGLERFTAPKDLSSVGIRVLFYNETYRIVRENPLLGVGPDQIPHHSAMYIDRNPHNFLLKNAADLGLPGLALYLGVLGIAAAGAGRSFRRAADREERIRALAFVLTLTVAVTNALYEPTLEGSAYGLIFWITAGALYGSIPGNRAARSSP